MKDSLGFDSLSAGLHSTVEAYRGRHPVPAPLRDLQGGRERVLVVDDNRALAESTRRLLAELGYEALACTDPLQAHRLFTDASQGGFDLLVTDYSMPHMSGYQLARLARESRPELRVLLCSAWPEEVIREKHPDEDWPPFLEKPFSLDVLASRVRAILDGDGPAGSCFRDPQ